MSQETMLACGIFFAMVVINWRMASAVLFALPLFGLFFWWLNPRLREASRATPPTTKPAIGLFSREDCRHGGHQSLRAAV